MHRKLPDPVVLPYPHQQRCDAPQGDLSPPMGQSADTEAMEDLTDYAMDVSLAGALQ